MSTTVLEATQVLTGLGTTMTPGSVVIDDLHIAWVGPPDEIPSEWRTSDTRRIQLPDTTLLPGLIDAHVHLTFDAIQPPRPTSQSTTHAEITPIVTTGLRHLLNAGVTTVRDLGGPHYIDIDTLAQAAAGPRTLTATIPLTVPGGHCDSFGGAVNTVADIRGLVANNSARGADWIKIMVTGGFTTSAHSSPYEPQFTHTQVHAAVDAAHERGLPVSAHAHGTAGIRQAVAAGVDSIEHCTWMAPDGFDLDPGLVRDIAEQQIVVCPTVNHLARGATGRLPWTIRRKQLQIMLDAGVRLVPGSDSGIPNTPHERYPHSLPAYTDLGLTPTQVIHLATRQAANALQVGHLTGALAAGMSADLTAVPGDPTQDLNVLSTPILVATAGHLHYPDTNIRVEEDASI